MGLLYKSVVMLSVTNKPIMLSVVMLSVGMLNIVAPNYNIVPNNVKSYKFFLPKTNFLLFSRCRFYKTFLTAIATVGK
jgi:hypothetical protein